MSQHVSTPPTQLRPSGLRWWKELVYMAVFYAAYSFVRNQFGSQGTGDVDASVAFDHARAVIDLERALGLYFEAELQEWYLDLPASGLIRVWNIFYGTAHFAVTLGALFLAFRRVPQRYRRWRNALAVTTGIALVGFASYSLMPPRLLDDPGRFGGCQVYAPAEAAIAEELERAEEAGDVQRSDPGEAGRDSPLCDRYGYVDTLEVHGGWLSFEATAAAPVTNQYAAMPSLHVGWSVWSAMVLFSMSRRRWTRALAVAYPLVTLFVIVVTANHFWLDAVGGLAALGIGTALAWRFTSVT